MSMGIVDRLISFVNPVEDGDAREQAGYIEYVQARSGHGQKGFGLHVRMYICLRRRPSEDI